MKSLLNHRISTLIFYFCLVMVGTEGVAQEYRFEIDAPALDIPVVEKLAPYEDPPLDGAEAENDLPKFDLPNVDNPLYFESIESKEPKGMSKVQQNAFDIFSTTLAPEDARSFRFSPGGGGALVEELDYLQHSETLKNDYSIFAE